MEAGLGRNVPSKPLILSRCTHFLTSVVPYDDMTPANDDDYHYPFTYLISVYDIAVYRTNKRLNVIANGCPGESLRLLCWCLLMNRVYPAGV